jgi:hypothetical protein
MHNGFLIPALQEHKRRHYDYNYNVVVTERPFREQIQANDSLTQLTAITVERTRPGYDKLLIFFAQMYTVLGSIRQISYSLDP